MTRITCKRLKRHLVEGLDRGERLSCKNRRKPAKPICRCCGALIKTVKKTVQTVRLQARKAAPSPTARKALRAKLLSCVKKQPRKGRRKG